MHTHTFTCAQILKHIHTYTPMFTRPYMHAIHPHSHTVTHLHTYTCSHAHTHVHAHSRMLIRSHTCPLTDTPSHTCSHTHIHAHTHSAPAPGQLWTDYLALLIYRQTSSWGRKSGRLLITLRVSLLSRRKVKANMDPAPSSETKSETPAGR